MFFDKVASVARLSLSPTDTKKEQYSALPSYASIKINIQPATIELTAMAEGVYGQTYQAFVTVSGISVGDQITVSGTGQKFIVKGVGDWNWGPIPHAELILFKGDN